MKSQTKKVYTQKELTDIIEGVIKEIKTQEKYNTGKEPEWIPEDVIMTRLCEYIGSDWRVSG